jgi:hypothetical protein
MLSLSCSRAKPDITFGFLQLVLYQGDSGVQEHFSFFIIPHDEDGIDNLDKLYLYNDKEQLCWEINNDEWIIQQDDYRTWIGTRSITIPEGTLPRGVYRAVLVNKGGESTERNFPFDGNVKFPFPDIVISGGNYIVNSQWPVNRLLCYDALGTFVNQITLQSLTGPISQLNLSSNIVTVALWAEDEANSCSAYTNVVNVRN